MLPMIPGAAAASEIMWLLELGYLLHKFFPAELAVYYLVLENIAAVCGSWIGPRLMIAAKDFEGIAQLTADATHLV